MGQAKCAETWPTYDLFSMEAIVWHGCGGRDSLIELEELLDYLPISKFSTRLLCFPRMRGGIKRSDWRVGGRETERFPKDHTKTPRSITNRFIPGYMTGIRIVVSSMTWVTRVSRRDWDYTIYG
jgi:hypothetical protein